MHRLRALQDRALLAIPRAVRLDPFDAQRLQLLAASGSGADRLRAGIALIEPDADGVVRRRCPIRVLRGNVVIFEGELESLRRHKDDVTEVRAGTECGIAVKQYDDVRVGDQIECYERVTVERTL